MLQPLNSCMLSRHVEHNIAYNLIVINRTPEHGEDSLEIAEVYFLYGRALLENAISQSSVLGKGQAEGGAPPVEECSFANALTLSVLYINIFFLSYSLE